MYLQSPYTSLSDALFSPSATGRSSGSTVNQISSASDPYAKLRAAGGHGLARNLFDAVAGSGAAAGAQAAAPIQQQMQDSQANAGWNLQKAQASGAFANDAFGLLGQQNLNNQQFGRSLLSSMPGLMGGLFG